MRVPPPGCQVAQGLEGIGYDDGQAVPGYVLPGDAGRIRDHSRCPPVEGLVDEVMAVEPIPP